MKANSLEELVTNSNIAGELRNYTDWHTRLVKFAQLVANWQKEQNTREMVMSDGSYFQKCYELGKKDMKQQMLEEAVEGVLVDNIDGTQDICLYEKRFGQKIRIVVLKEEE